MAAVLLTGSIVEVGRSRIIVAASLLTAFACAWVLASFAIGTPVASAALPMAVMLAVAALSARGWFARPFCTTAVIEARSDGLFANNTLVADRAALRGAFVLPLGCDRACVVLLRKAGAPLRVDVP